MSRRTADKLRRQEREGLTRSIGMVTATSPLTVTIGNVDHANLKKLSSYTPSVGHRVLVLHSGADLVVLGQIN